MMKRMYLRHARRVLALVGIGALVLALASCGDDGDETEEFDDTTSTTTVVEDGSEEAVTVDAEIYFAGFRVEVDEAAVVADELTETVTVTVETAVENLSEDDAVFPAEELELQWGTGAVTGTGGDIVRPGATSSLPLEFVVDGTFAFDDATLVAGTESQIQATLPLSDPAEVIPAEPIALEVPADPAGDGPFEVTVTDLALVPWNAQGEQQPVDEPVLAFTVDLTLGESRYDANVLDSGFRLVLPDGTEVTPDGSVNEVLSANSSVTDVAVTFALREVPFDPEALPEDEFTLVAGLTSVDQATEDAEVQIAFTLVPAA